MMSILVLPDIQAITHGDKDRRYEGMVQDGTGYRCVEKVSNVARRQMRGVELASCVIM